MKVTIELDLSNDIFGEKSDSYIEELFNEMVEDTVGMEVSDISISERPEKKANPNKLTKETFNPDAFKYVDLGLPSGRLWATENAPDYYTHYEAVDIFGKFLPKAVAIAELVEECKWTWNSDKKGYDVVGPNGNSIFLPASGYRGRASGALGSVGSSGYYWSFASYSQASAYYLNFGSSGLYPLDGNYRAIGFAVRPCRELN